MCLREVEPYPQSTPSVGELVVGLKGPRVLAPLKGPAHRRELRWPSQGWHEPRGAPKVLTPRDGAACQASRSLSLAGVPPARPPSWNPVGPVPAPGLGPGRGDPRPACASASWGGRSRPLPASEVGPPQRTPSPRPPPTSSHCVRPPSSVAAARGARLQERHPSANAPGGGAGRAGRRGRHCPAVLVYSTVPMSDHLNLNLFKIRILYKNAVFKLFVI